MEENSTCCWCIVGCVLHATWQFPVAPHDSASRGSCNPIGWCLLSGSGTAAEGVWVGSGTLLGSRWSTCFVANKFPSLKTGNQMYLFQFEWFDSPTGWALSDWSVLWTVLQEELKACSYWWQEAEEISSLWRLMIQWRKFDWKPATFLSDCSVLWTFLSEELKSGCSTAKDPGETPFPWRHHPQWHWSDFAPVWVQYIWSGDWRLQQGGRWWHCPPDGLREPQWECHVAPPWGSSRFCRSLAPGCTGFYTSSGLYSRHLRPKPATPLLKMVNCVAKQEKQCSRQLQCEVPSTMTANWPARLLVLCLV